MSDDTPTPVLRGKKQRRSDENEHPDVDVIIEPGMLAGAVELDMTTLSDPIKDVVEYIGRGLVINLCCFFAVLIALILMSL